MTTNVASIRRAWRSSGGEFWVELRTREGADAAFGQVISDTTDHFQAEGFGFAQLNTRVATGFVVQVSDFTDETQLTRWFDELAVRLERAGFSGPMQAVRQADGPDWYSGGRTDEWTHRQRLAYPAEPTAFIRWSIDLDAMTADPGRTSHWSGGRCDLSNVR